MMKSFTQSTVLAAIAVLGLAAGSHRLAAADIPPSREDALIKILRSGAPPADKAIACKKLAVYGGKQAVPSLAPLLADKELSSWARIALEAIPDPEADAALREAMDKLQGRLLVGVINSLGVRRDAQSVSGLTRKLLDGDTEVAAAAAAALGCIGGDPAAKALEQSLGEAPAIVRAEVAEGLVRCAEKRMAEGKANEAARLYDVVRQANLPKQKQLEATRGAILARQGAGVPLLMETLRSTDKAMFGIGLRTARELPGREVTEALGAELEKASAERQPALLLLLADRGDAAVLPALKKAAQSGAPKTRLAAIGALERLASAGAIPVLLEVVAGEDAELGRAARAALVRLPGKEVNADLVARLAEATGSLRRVLVELAGQRRIAEAIPAVARAANDADPGVRRAAVSTLGAIGEEKQAAELVELLQKTQDAQERTAIEESLLAICSRRTEACRALVLPLARSQDSALRKSGLRLLASVGGAEALTAVKAAVEDKDESVQEEAVRTLSTWANNWPDDDGVAEPLLALVKSGQKLTYRVLGTRGYLQYVRGAKKFQDEEKVAKIKQLLPLLGRPEEKRLAISAVGAIPTAGSLEMLAALALDDSVAEEAGLTLCELAARKGLKGASKELREKSLRAAAEKSTSEAVRKRAEDLLKRLQ